MKIDRTSVDRHDSHYSIETTEEIKAIHEELTKKKVQYNADNPIGHVVDNIANKLNIAVDVGAGQGWGSNYLARHFQQVYSIEPSEHASRIAKELYGDVDNIKWINGFAEVEIEKLTLKEPSLFYTACVLSHLTDETVEKICSSINSVAKKGSFISMSENWSKDLHQNLWHSRTEDWWQRQFPDWELSFRDIPGSPIGVKKGIIGHRVK